MFQQAICYFRSDSDWEPNPVVFMPNADNISPSARFVMVALGNCMASAIRCRFAFSDIWMMFSELAFQSGNRGLIMLHDLSFISSTPFLICSLFHDSFQHINSLLKIQYICSLKCLTPKFTFRQCTTPLLFLVNIIKLQGFTQVHILFILDTIQNSLSITVCSHKVPLGCYSTE